MTQGLFFSPAEVQPHYPCSKYSSDYISLSGSFMIRGWGGLLSGEGDVNLKLDS